MQKTILASLAFATSSLFSIQAHAAIDISHAPQALEFLDGTTDFGASFLSNQKDNYFADQFTFSVGSQHTLESYLSSISASSSNGLTITDLTVRNSGGVVAHGMQESSGTIDIWSLYNVNLSAGAYYIQVDGYVNSNTGGSYGANVNVTPVPEPETWGMMLGGLSVLAALARRRKVAA